MPDPEMVSRAHRAAVTLERAWERWRIMHGLSAQPMPPVSSYVGYSIEEPWGRPRVVFGVDAHEAEMLAALLDRHECVGPFYQPEAPTHRSRTAGPGEPASGGTDADSAVRSQIPAQAGPVEETPGPVGPDAPAGPLTSEDMPAYPADDPVEDEGDWDGAPDSGREEADAAPVEADAVLVASGRARWGAVPAATPGHPGHPGGDDGGGPGTSVWEPSPAAGFAETAPVEAGPAGSDRAEMGAEPMCGSQERLPGGSGAPEWPGPDRQASQEPRFRDPARPRHRRPRPDSQGRAHKAAQPGAGREAAPRRPGTGWPADGPGAGAGHIEPGVGAGHIEPGVGAGHIEPGVGHGDPGGDPYARPSAEGHAVSLPPDPGRYVGHGGSPAAETTTEQVAGWAAGELPGRATARLAARGSATGWPAAGHGESGAHGAGAATPSAR